MTRKELSALFHKLKNCDKKMLAEKVESMDDLLFCHGLGFDLFQGYRSEG